MCYILYLPRGYDASARGGLVIPCHMIVAGYYCFTCDIRVSVCCQSIHISFPGDNLIKHQWIFTKRYVD